MRREFTTTLERRTHRSDRPSSLQEGPEGSWASGFDRSTYSVSAGQEPPAFQADHAEATSLRRPPPWLRFPAALEKAFHDDCLKARRQHLMLCALLGTLAFACATFITPQLLPDIQKALGTVRLSLVGFMLASVALMHAYKGRSHHPAELLISVNALAIVAFIIWMTRSSHALTAVTHSMSVFAIPVYLCVVALQRFWYAAASTLGCLLAYSLLVQPQTPQEQLVVAVNIKMLWVCGGLALLANYVFERNERIAFLLRKQEEGQKARLEQLRNRLRRQSMIDALTGINNRRFLDHWLARTWAAEQHHRHAVGLLMIDIDFFKAYNDHYGHVAGDECLRQVAHLVSQVAEIYQGHAVRFGGEEFVLILPGANVAHALHAARKMCQTVIDAQLPHAVSATLPVISVSVGAASLKPSPQVEPASLIALADTALYQAKEQGRNRACAAAPHRSAAGARGPAGAQASPSPPRVEETVAGDRIRQIDQLLQGDRRWLAFPPSLEMAYEKTRRHLRRCQLFFIGLAGVATFYALAGSGSALAPDIAAQLKALQYDFTLGLIAALLLMWLPGRTWHRELVFAACTSALAICAVHVLAQSTALTVYSYSVVVFLIPAFSTIGARQPIWFAWMPSAATIGAYLLLMRGHSPMTDLMVRDSAIQLTQTVLLSLFGCYTLERRARTAFLLHLRGKLQRQSLQTMSQQLQAMALTDALSGLSNRRQFDLDMETSWEHARHARSPLSLLLVDVDCFKAYNDHYGHLKGDHCLQDIAQAIGQQAIRAQGLSARIGGEEFAILLPDHDTLAALAAGERLCQAIAAMALSHERSTAGPVVTVSVGVATIVPELQSEAGRQLLSQSDEALYLAKAAGRNRVMAATRAVV